MKWPIEKFEVKRNLENKKVINQNKNGITILDKIICSGYFVMMLVIVGICVFGSGIYYSRKTDTLLPEVVLLIVGYFSLLLLMMLVRKVNKVRMIDDRIIWICSIVFLVFQIYCVWNYYFLTDWDVKTVMNASIAAANGADMEVFQSYFSIYPNNLFLVWIYGRLICFFQVIGLNYRMGILVCQCGLSWGTVIILYYVVKEITKNRCASCFAWVIYLLLVGISPWVSIPYSDSMGLIFPIAILGVYIWSEKCLGKIRIYLWGVIGFLTIIGYHIKPQITIVPIAIWIYVICLSFSKKKELAYRISYFLVGCVAGVLISSICINSLEITIDENKTYGISHFLMMGMNHSEGFEGNGVWNEDDVNFSASFDTAEERKKENLCVFRERIREMGIPGISNLMQRKTLTNYNDGTFAWGWEGAFYVEKLSTKSNPLSEFLGNLYYNREWNGKYYKYFYNFELMIWLTVLFCTLLCVVQKKEMSFLGTVMLSIIGLTVFELIFEARARYLYTYIPMYIILASASFPTKE